MGHVAPPGSDFPSTEHQVFASASHQASQCAQGGGSDMDPTQSLEKSAPLLANALNLGERSQAMPSFATSASDRRTSASNRRTSASDCRTSALGSAPFYAPGLSPKETSRLLGHSSRQLDLEASKSNAELSIVDQLSIAAVNNVLDMETPIPDMELCITKQGQLDVWREALVFLCMFPCFCLRFLVAQLALDTELIFVGHLGVPQLAGVGLVRFWVAIPFWFLYSSMRAVYVLGMQAKQRGNDRAAGLWLQTGLGFAFLGTIAVIFYYLHSPDLVGLAEFNDVTIGFAREYAPIILVGVFPSLSMAAMDNFMRVQGITLPAFVCATVACVVNITLHFVFIYGAFGWAGWGFVGSPWATVTSLIVQVALYVAYTVGAKRYHARYWSEWTWDSHRFGQYRQFWRVAAPLGGATMVFCIAFCAIGAMTSYVPSAATPSRRLRQLDDDVDAGSERAGAWVLSFCLFMIVVAMFLGVAETTKTRMLVYLANGRPDLARRVLFVGLGYSVAFALAFASALFAYKGVVFRIWTNDAGVLAQCIDVVRWIIVCLVLASMRVVLAGGLIVLQKRPMVVLAEFINIWCCQVPCSFVLPILLQFPGLNGFWIAVAVGEGVHVLLLVYALCKSTDDRAVMKAVQAALVSQQPTTPALDDKDGPGHGEDPYAVLKPVLLPTAIFVHEAVTGDQVVVAKVLNATDDGPSDPASTSDASDVVAIDFLTESSSGDEQGSVGSELEPLPAPKSLVLGLIQVTSAEMAATLATLAPSDDAVDAPERALPLVASATPPVSSSVRDEDGDSSVGRPRHGRRSPAQASGSSFNVQGDSPSHPLTVAPSPDLVLPFSPDNTSTTRVATEHAIHATPNSDANSDDSTPRLVVQSSLNGTEDPHGIAPMENHSAPAELTQVVAATAVSHPSNYPTARAVPTTRPTTLPNAALVDPVVPSPATSDATKVLPHTSACQGQSPFATATESLDTPVPSVDQTTRNVTISADPVRQQGEDLPGEQPTILAQVAQVDQRSKHPTPGEDHDPPQQLASSTTMSAPWTQSDVAGVAQVAATRAIVADISAAAPRDRVVRSSLPSPQAQINAQSRVASAELEPGIPLKSIHAATPNAVTSPPPCPEMKSPLSSEAGDESSEEGVSSYHGNPSEVSESESVASSTGKRRRRPKVPNAPLPPSVQVETLGGVDITTLQFGKRSKKRRMREEKSRRESTSPVRQRRPSAFGFQASLD